ncbi:MAG: MFS transporter, partial [Myxococcota bacterium]|nr:MFS transporter [Myxococcota bacterium]
MQGPSVRRSIATLLLGMAILLVGNGYFTTSVGLGAAEGGFAASAIGWMMAAYFGGYVVGSAFVPRFVRTVGHVRVFAAMAAVVAAAAILHGLVLDPWVWGVLRLVAGAGMLGLYLVIESWLNGQATAATRGRILAIYMVVAEAALGLGQVLVLVDGHGSAVAFGIVALLFCLGLVPVLLTRVREPVVPDGPMLSMRRLYHVAPLGVVGTAVAGVVAGGIWGIGPVFARAVGLDAAGIAGFMGAVIFGGILLQFPIGALSDRGDRRVVMTAVAFAGAVVSVVATELSVRAPGALLAAGVAFGGLTFPLYALCIAHVNDRLEHPEVLGAARVLLLVYGVGATAGPAAAGHVVHRFGAPGLFAWFAVVLLVLGVYAAYRLRYVAAVPETQREEFVPLMRTSVGSLELIPGYTVEGARLLRWTSQSFTLQ